MGFCGSKFHGANASVVALGISAFAWIASNRMNAPTLSGQEGKKPNPRGPRGIKVPKLAYATGNKNDSADARAIWMATQMPSKAVAAKTTMTRKKMPTPRVRTIAVIDDDRRVLRSFSNLLASGGYETRAYESAPDFFCRPPLGSSMRYHGSGNAAD
jgi:hypothetical protein